MQFITQTKLLGCYAFEPHSIQMNRLIYWFGRRGGGEPGVMSRVATGASATLSTSLHTTLPSPIRSLDSLSPNNSTNRPTVTCRNAGATPRMIYDRSSLISPRVEMPPNTHFPPSHFSTRHTPQAPDPRYPAQLPPSCCIGGPSDESRAKQRKKRLTEARNDWQVLYRQRPTFSQVKPSHNGPRNRLVVLVVPHAGNKK